MVNAPLTGEALNRVVRHIFAPVASMSPIIEASHLNLHHLVELASRQGGDIRPTLLRVMTALYVQKPRHSEQEEKQFTELALRLLDLVDGPTQAVVADMIGAYPNAPAAVRERLLKDMIAVTDRAALPSTSDATAVRANLAVADELSELFLAANSEERRLILLNLPYAPLPLAAPVPQGIARESTHRLEAAALGHNTELFARELERTLSISRNLARRLIEDTSGEPIVVAAIALSMPAAVLQRILLCLNPVISQSVQRVYELALLHEEVEPEAAFQLMAIWQASHKAEKKVAAARPSSPVHQPQLWPDEKSKGPAPFARPKIRWDEYSPAPKAESG
jgi:hypothetical protein